MNKVTLVALLMIKVNCRVPLILLGREERAHASLGQEIKMWAACSGDAAMGFMSGAASMWPDKECPQQLYKKAIRKTKQGVMKQWLS